MEELNEKNCPIQLVWSIKNIILLSLFVAVLAPFLVITGCNGSTCDSNFIPQTFSDLYIALFIMLIGILCYDLTFIFYRKNTRFNFAIDKFYYTTTFMNISEIFYNQIKEIKLSPSLSDQAFKLSSIKITFQKEKDFSQTILLQGLKEIDAIKIFTYVNSKLK